MAGTCRQPWSWLTARLSPAADAAVAASEKAEAIREERGQPGDMTLTAACKEARSNWAQQLGKSWANADHAASSEWLDTQPPALRNFMSALLSLVCCLLSILLISIR